MIIKYTEEEYKNAKSTDYLKLECKVCGKIFLQRKSLITSELRNPKGRNVYCSQECSHSSQKKEPIQIKCNYCGKVFNLTQKEYHHHKSEHFFCSRECSRAYSSIRNKKINQFNDETFIKLISESKSFNELGKKIGYSCSNSRFNEYVKERCKKLNIKIKFRQPYKMTEKNSTNPIKEMTKGELLLNRSSYQSYRSAIRKDADKTFKKEDGNCACCICGYNKHVQIAHIKPVSSFKETDLIGEINNIKNLVPLCPNHHWEYDNDKMDAQDLEKINKYIKVR